ncbi:sensor histidine kinase [Nonomuraea harbinensis]|uniref:histidine kinase n=1 Tax=Nonomuraea harbinensis TaxID=1286938 RepID=A0ABW1C809_9ACTN|nr:ATP-binding protein [Nonomuraea harbinensis]
MNSVALLEQRGDNEHELARVGDPSGGHNVIDMAAGPGLRFVGQGPQPFAEDRRVLTALAQAAGRAVEGRRLAAHAAHARQLSEIDRVRSALLAAVGHDLRTPLAGIKAAVSSLRQADVDSAELDRQELLATIEESADRLGELIANLLDMSRLQTGVLSVTPHPVALEEIVARALIHQHAADIRSDVPEGLPDVLADAGLCERVIANLLDNARRYCPPGRPIEVRAHAGTATVTLQVADHGPGVPRNRWEEMFQPFQRLDDRSPQGNGLGLAIARGFTHAMAAPCARPPRPAEG